MPVITLSPPPPLPRRIRRRKRPITVAAFPKTWMVLTGCLMLDTTAFQGHHPSYPVPAFPSIANHIHQCSTAVYTRIEQLDDLVVLNVDTLVQYQTLKYRSVRNIMRSHGPQSIPLDIPMTAAELNEFFDSYSEPPEERGDSFFDLFATEGEALGRKCHDPFAVHELSHSSSFVDCVRDSVGDEIKRDRAQWANGPTTTLERGLSSTAFNLLSTDPHAMVSIGGGGQRQPVIFDTEASLGITFDKDDFDGPITIPEGELRLGGMAQGLKIEGVGPVTWTFRNTDGSELRIRSCMRRRKCVPECSVSREDLVCRRARV